MSTTPQPQPSPGLLHFQLLFNNIAQQQVQNIIKIGVDIQNKDPLSAILDSMNAAQGTLSQIRPRWGADAGVANSIAQTGLSLVFGFIQLFHKPAQPPAQG